MRATEAAYRIAASLGLRPKMVILVEFADIPLRWTSHWTDVTYDGDTYSARGLNAEELGETLLLRSPTPRLTVTSLDATEQARFDAGTFEGEAVTIRWLWLNAGTFETTGWISTYRVDSAAASDDGVTLQLGTIDAVQGTMVPRFTTQEAGCQREFRKGGCWYRPPMSEGGQYPTSSPLYTRCDHTLDGPLGCRAHFPDVDYSGLPITTSTTPRLLVPKPYAAWPGSVQRVFA